MTSDIPYDDLTDNPTLQSIAQIAGDAVATQLSVDFGGIRLHIPQKPGPHSPLCISIGMDSALKIAQIYGGMHFDVPLALGKRAQIIDMIGQNMSAATIARTLRCTTRTVYKIREDLRKNDQLSLPV